MVRHCRSFLNNLNWSIKMMYKLQSTSYVKVESGVVVSHPFTLPQNYVNSDGSTTHNVELLSDEEKRSIGLYRVVEFALDYDERIQKAEPVWTVTDSVVELTYNISMLPIDLVKQAYIDKAYRKSQAELNKITEGYSAIEIATFPILQAEVKNYNKTGVVGPTLEQAVIDSRIHTLESLVALITNKIAIQSYILEQRNEVVARIKNAVTHSEIVN